MTRSPKEGPGWLLAEQRRCETLWGVTYPLSGQSPAPLSSPLLPPSPSTSRLILWLGETLQEHKALQGCCSAVMERRHPLGSAWPWPEPSHSLVGVMGGEGIRNVLAAAGLIAGQRGAAPMGPLPPELLSPTSRVSDRCVSRGGFLIMMTGVYFISNSYLS